MTKDDGKAIVFRVSANGLYYYDAKAAADKSATVLVNTVDDNKTMHTKAKVSKAEFARALQRKLGHVSEAEFIRIVTNNLLPNYPVTEQDIMAASRHLRARPWVSEGQDCAPSSIARGMRREVHTIASIRTRAPQRGHSDGGYHVRKC